MSFQTVTEAFDSRLGLSGAHKGVDLVTQQAVLRARKRANAMEIPQPSFTSLVEKAQQRVGQILQFCESPIERLMLPALVFADYGASFASFPAQIHIPSTDDPPRGDLVIIPQFAFVKYRFDFGVLADIDGHWRITAVECDGEEYHQDAVKDRRRDAYLKAFGITTFRFKGTDIQADPLPLAAQVAAHVQTWRASL